jgi:hypothetical protein
MGIVYLILLDLLSSTDAALYAAVAGRSVAVGTGIAPGPRADPDEWRECIRGPHRVFGVEPFVRMGMHDLRVGKQPIRERTEGLPTQSVLLATATDRPQPVPRHLSAEGPQGPDVAGDGELPEVPHHHTTQPLGLLPDRAMASADECIANRLQPSLPTCECGPNPENVSTCIRLNFEHRTARCSSAFKIQTAAPPSGP